jgi:UDP-N-acetylmuramate dehydrogenase
MIHKENVSLCSLTSFQNEGSVPHVFVFDTAEEMSDYVSEHDDYLVLGKGSNTIINPSDSFFPIIQLSSQYMLPVLDGDVVEVGAGVGVNQLMAFSKDTGFSGFEFMAGVPASVGGMVAMNFGCWGKEIVDMLESVDVLFPDGQIERKCVSELSFSYRYSSFQVEPWIVVSARFRGGVTDIDRVKKDIFDKVQSRLESQPLRAMTFGSVFRNPDGQYAAALLETSGFKGFRKGAVMFSNMHANFMVNLGGATFDDVVALLQEAESKVKDSHGVSLQTEVVLASI